MRQSRALACLGLAALLGLASGCGKPEEVGPSGDSRSRRSRDGILPKWLTPEELQARSAHPLREAREAQAAPAGARTPAEFEPVGAVVMAWTAFPEVLQATAEATSRGGADVWMLGGPASIPDVPAERYRSLDIAFDTVWIRDYGPFGLQEAGGPLGIADLVYGGYYSRWRDDQVPCALASDLGASCYGSNLIFDGGNFLVDGRGNLFMTRATDDWNGRLTEAEVDAQLRAAFNVQRIYRFDYARTSGGSPADGTGHIDMYAKIVAPCRVLVSQSDQVPFAAPLEEMARIFAGLECEPGRTYEVFRIPGWYANSTWYTYTNSTMVNRVAIVPSYRSGQDTEAKAVYQRALPGYEIALVPSDEPIPYGGAVHCITMQLPALEVASWDVEAASTDTPLAIPDNVAAGVNSRIAVPSSGSIEALEVEVKVTHPYVGDLVVALVSPNGTRQVLQSRTGGSADNLDKRFALTAFNGTKLAGTWTLNVSDQDARDTGRLERWTLRARVGTSENRAPVANAGADLAVASGAQVTLNGSASSDPDGDALTYQWRQLQGPAVSLTGATTATPGFTAPAVAQETVLSFELVVSDGQLQSPADAVTVTVRPSAWRVEQTSSDTPKAIPDANRTGISSAMAVSGAGDVTAAEVEVHISHSYIGDLRVVLSCPNGAQTVLHSQTGGGTDNLNAVYPVTACNGQALTGSWKLSVADVVSRDVGRLESWTLRLR